MKFSLQAVLIIGLIFLTSYTNSHVIPSYYDFFGASDNGFGTFGQNLPMNMPTQTFPSIIDTRSTIPTFPATSTPTLNNLIDQLGNTLASPRSTIPTSVFPQTTIPQLTSPATTIPLTTTTTQNSFISLPTTTTYYPSYTPSYYTPSYYSNYYVPKSTYSEEYTYKPKYHDQQQQPPTVIIITDDDLTDGFDSPNNRIIRRIRRRPRARTGRE